MGAGACEEMADKLYKQFKGKTVVIKYGGSITKDVRATDALMEDIAALKEVGARIVVVHGGGPDINRMLGRLDMKAEFVKGLRVTEATAIEVVEMVLSGKVNKELTSRLLGKGVAAVGISGRDGRLIEAEKMYAEEDGEKIDIGFVGRVAGINNKIVRDLLDMGYVPVISPVAEDRDGNVYNINADYVAAAIGISLDADSLVYLSDVDGLFGDINDRKSLIGSITAAEIERLIGLGAISGGMIPKMKCCTEAIEKGVKSVCLIGGQRVHALRELVQGEPVGTIIKGGEYHV
ncbi:MAG TPA: acetylglutamate kinase [Clostridia bacterium]|nr:acetylglutamate kinase [Clostridia bacterium]